MSTKSTDWISIFEIKETGKHKDGFTVFQVSSQVFNKNAPEGLTKIVVWKRYSDFKALHSKLELIHRQLHLPGKFPSFPRANFFGRFEKDVIDERKAASLTLLQFASSHFLLFTNSNFTQFFEESYSRGDILIINESSSIGCGYNEINHMSLDQCLIPEQIWVKNSPSPYSSSNSNQSSNFQNLENISIIRNSYLEDLAFPSSSSSSSSSTSSIQSSNDSILSGSIPSLDTKFIGEIVTNINSPPLLVDLKDLKSNRHIENVSSLPLSILPSTSSSAINLTQLTLKDPITIGDKIKDKNDKISLMSSTASIYIHEAFGHFALAQTHESNSSFYDALIEYKEGIDILLHGVKNDEDKDRKFLVKKKLEKFLNRAEKIQERTRHREHRAELNLNPNPPEDLNFKNDYFSKLICESSTNESKSKTISNCNTSHIIVTSPITELKNYKIVRIIDNKIYIVVNTKEYSGPRCYAIKILRISCFPVDEALKPTIVPFDNVRFMVRLVKYFKTENSHILLLEFAGGGQLINFISSYKSKIERSVSSYSALLFDYADSKKDACDLVNDEKDLGNLKLEDNAAFGDRHFEGDLDENFKDTSFNRFRIIPEGCLKVWAAEIILCLQSLHNIGLIYGDLEMKNILLGENGHILLSYKSQWSDVDERIYPMINNYSAPELELILSDSNWRLHHSCDFWSLGAILFELFTGKTVHSYHPEGFHAQTVLRVPEVNSYGDDISLHVKTLLLELLEISPNLRLGFYGAEEVKAHPFFSGLDWDGLSSTEMFLGGSSDLS